MERDKPTFNLQALRQFAIDRWPREMGRTHGVGHWDRVARNGKRLYVEGADRDVIAAFAYLHDSQRRSNGPDLEHGPRAARFVDTIRHTYLQVLSDHQIALLKRACELHTVRHRTGNITVDICFDADRLDLPRVGITPNPHRMATALGARLAAEI